LVEAKERIKKISNEIHSRLETDIYGKDGTSLPLVINKHLEDNDLHLSILANIDNKYLYNQIIEFNRMDLKVIPAQFAVNEHFFESELDKIITKSSGNVVLGIYHARQIDKHVLKLWIHPKKEKGFSIKYFGGPDEMSDLWCVNTSLDHLRRFLIKEG